MDAVESAPVMAQRAIEKSYEGIEIEWELKFKGADLVEKNRYHISTTVDIFPWVYFDVNITKYPKLKVLKYNEKLVVSGKIQSVRGHDIRLSGASIKFPLPKEKIASSTPVSIQVPTTLTSQVFHVNTQQAHFGQGHNISSPHTNLSKSWWKKPEVMLPIFIALLSIPWWPTWFSVIW